MYDYLIVGHGSWHATNYRQWLAVHRDLWQ